MLKSDEAEQNVLGSCLLNEQAIYHVMDFLEPPMFFDGVFREIYTAMLTLVQKNQPIDISLLTQEIPQRSEKIIEIYKAQASSRNVLHYANQVMQFWQERELERAGRQIVGFAHEEGGLSRALSLIMGLAGGERGGFVGTRERLLEVVKYLEAREKADGCLIGHSTGLADLDKVLSGWRDGCLYIVAGRPAMGKTVFALNTLLPTARVGLPVLFFSMEMPARELDLRVMSNVGNIPQDKMQSAKFSENGETDYWPSVTKATALLKEMPFLVDETPAQTLAAITAKSKREALKHGKIGLIVVDYIGLMRGDGDNRTQEVGSISRGLKALAKEMSCPVIALAQLNRKCEERGDKRPVMSDLRDSGDIEQDADAVIMLYRDVVYNPTSPLAQNGIAEVLVRKNRHGEVREIRVIDQLKFQRFANATGVDHIPAYETPSKRASRGYGE